MPGPVTLELEDDSVEGRVPADPDLREGGDDREVDLDVLGVVTGSGAELLVGAGGVE